MGEMMLCFRCCVTQQPPQKRRRIDRSMIGYPTNFKHTGHIGRDASDDNSNSLVSVQGQMSMKGGYEHVTPVNVELSLMDVQKQS